MNNVMNKVLVVLALAICMGYWAYAQSMYGVEAVTTTKKLRWVPPCIDFPPHTPGPQWPTDAPPWMTFTTGGQTAIQIIYTVMADGTNRWCMFDVEFTHTNP